MEKVDYSIDTAQHAEKVAAEKGLITIVPDDYTAIADFDSPTLPADFVNRIGTLNRFIPVESVVTTVSASGNTHAYVKFKRIITDEQRLIIQSTLGSDWQREMLGWQRLLVHGSPATVAFEKPDVKYIPCAGDWRPNDGV